jgi:hypothetical protein
VGLFTTSEARSAYRSKHSDDVEFKASKLNVAFDRLERLADERSDHDVFVSYSHLDSAVALGVCYMLRKDFGLRVYLDRDDADLPEDDETVAASLKTRMRKCRSLFYLAGQNAAASHWTPWELGYFDGWRGTVAVLPVSDSPLTLPKERAYLRLYPYIDKTAGTLRVNHRDGNVQPFSDWLSQRETAKVAGGR